MVKKSTQFFPRKIKTDFYQQQKKNTSNQLKLCLFVCLSFNAILYFYSYNINIWIRQVQQVIIYLLLLLRMMWWQNTERKERERSTTTTPKRGREFFQLYLFRKKFHNIIKVSLPIWYNWRRRRRWIWFFKWLCQSEYHLRIVNEFN